MPCKLGLFGYSGPNLTCNIASVAVSSSTRQNRRASESATFMRAIIACIHQTNPLPRMERRGLVPRVERRDLVPSMLRTVISRRLNSNVLERFLCFLLPMRKFWACQAMYMWSTFYINELVYMTILSLPHTKNKANVDSELEIYSTFMSLVFHAIF